jgi:hypothetical protein
MHHHQQPSLQMTPAQWLLQQLLLPLLLLGCAASPMGCDLLAVHVYNAGKQQDTVNLRMCPVLPCKLTTAAKTIVHDNTVQGTCIC